MIVTRHDKDTSWQRHVMTVTHHFSDASWQTCNVTCHVSDASWHWRIMTDMSLFSDMLWPTHFSGVSCLTRHVTVTCHDNDRSLMCHDSDTSWQWTSLIHTGTRTLNKTQNYAIPAVRPLYVSLPLLDKTKSSFGRQVSCFNIFPRKLHIHILHGGVLWAGYYGILLLYNFYRPVRLVFFEQFKNPSLVCKLLHKATYNLRIHVAQVFDQ